MFEFHRIKQAYPQVRAPEQRRDDFNEIYTEYDPKQAEAQASRCSQCGIPFCQVHCPLGNNIPDWLQLSAEGNWKEAYEVASATNTFPEICGRICPQDRLCEGNCVVNKGFDAITIGSIEKHITETAWEHGWVQPFSPQNERSESVGIIGAGPAGLAAAEQLRRGGYQVHVYDRYDRVGGLMIYGIPNFKLEKHVVARREEQYRASGITFHLNCEIGRDLAFDELRARHDAVLLATGVYQARELGVPGVGLQGVVPALDFLTISNRQGLGDAPAAFADGSLNAEGKRVVVIGGGDTAMDCVRTSVRQGAKSVTCLYRRDRENMPGSMREVGNAEAEGVRFEWLSAPKALDGQRSVSRVLVQRMRLGAADASGRRQPEALAEGEEGASFDVPADLTIMALGFEGENLCEQLALPSLALRAGNRIQVDKRYRTSLDGVFAAGDIVRGASLVVWAIREGREAAQAMHQYMQKQTRKVA